MSAHGLFWILDEQGEPTQAESLDDWLFWTQEAEKTDVKRVARTEVGPYWVSTVFLTTAVWSPGPPLLFETMIFRDDHVYPVDDPYQKRYATRQEAEQGHEEAVDWVKQLQVCAPPEEVPDA